MADWWANAPPISPAAPQTGAGGNWWDQAPPTAPVTPWADVGIQAIGNLPSSALKFAKDIAQPVLHPIDTAKGLYNVGAGALDMADAATNAFLAPYVESNLPSVAKVGESLPEPTFAKRYEHALALQKGQWGGDEAYPKAVGQYFGDRYGSVEGFKKAVGRDPVGVAGDVSLALTGAGGLAARAPGVVGKVGDIARAAGDAINPIMGPAKAVGAGWDEYKRLTEHAAGPTTEQLHEAADAAYSDPAIKELAVRPSAIKQWKDELLVALNDDGFNDLLAPRTFGTLSGLDKAPGSSTFTGQGFDTLRKMLRRAASVPDATERAAASRAIESLDDFLGNVPKKAVLRGDPDKVSASLTEARGNYAAAKRSEEIESALDRASLQAGSANSGMNLDNATRQRIKDILNSDKRKRGFSKEELAQMRQIVTGTPVQNAARRVGNMMGGGGGLGSTILSAAGGAAGAMAGHGPGAALGVVIPQAVGYGLKKLSAAMSQADVRRLQEIVRARSPLGRQMQSSLSKFGQAGVAASGSPTPKNVARLMLASRNLSSNLADAGITASPDDIAGSLGAK